MDTLLKLAAESEIRNLIAEYAHKADDGDAVGFALLFSPDGALEIGGHQLVGRQAIQEWLPTTLTQGALRHLMTNIHIVIESADSARCSLDLLLLKQVGDEWKIRMTSRYEDRLVNVDGSWLFQHRHIMMR